MILLSFVQGLSLLGNIPEMFPEEDNMQTTLHKTSSTDTPPGCQSIDCGMIGLATCDDVKKICLQLAYKIFTRAVFA